ncbi:polysaccharide lyase 8 family protein [Roseateles sp. LYH14W]|uniref:Polysaccharide lyase 8 family protein n=1 Tax=Pelomonas parva TaxID=3299032 RepID=A0ABW7EY22_9BURK
MRVLLLLLCWPCLAWAAPAEDAMLARASALLLAAPAQLADADVAAEIRRQQALARELWQTLDTRAVRRELWADLAAKPRSEANSLSFKRLRTLALAHAQPGSALHGHAELAEALRRSLDWLVEHHYRPDTPYSGNWWDWEIGSPQSLLDCLLLLHDELGAERRARYLASITRWVPDATRRLNGSTAEETGANRVDKALIVVLSGALEGDARKVAAGRAALDAVFPYVTHGDGFHSDGSFIQHDFVPYTGSYGTVLLAALARLTVVLGDGALTDAQRATLAAWADDAFLPVLVRGAVLDSVRGRAISRPAEEGRAGRTLLRDLLRLSAQMPPGLRARLKFHLLHDKRQPDYYRGLDAPSIAELKALAADATTAQQPAPDTKVFAAMDRAVHHRPGFAWALSLFSPRIAAFEYGNGENPRGWLTGAGMTTLLLPGDDAQFADGYWATVDMARLPGVTTSGHLPAEPPRDFSMVPNPEPWVGGAALPGGSGVAGMAFNLRNLGQGELSGRKSWFMFGDRMLALGSDIRGEGAVETIVDQRKLPQPDAVLHVDGQAPTTHRASRPARTAQLAGVGYHFPTLLQPQLLNISREWREGSWRAINPAGSPAPLRRAYASLALQHGHRPDGASYAYTTLPGISADALARYADAPPLRILALDAQAHAAADADTGMAAATFWGDEQHTVVRDGQPWMVASGACAVVLHNRSDGSLQLAVSAPTQPERGSLMLELHTAVSPHVAHDPAIHVLSTSPTLRLRIALEGLRGRSVQLLARKP